MLFHVLEYLHPYKQQDSLIPITTGSITGFVS